MRLGRGLGVIPNAADRRRGHVLTLGNRKAGMNVAVVVVDDGGDGRRQWLVF